MDKEKIEGVNKDGTIESLARPFVFGRCVHSFFAVHRISYGNGIGSDILLSFEWRSGVYGVVAH